MCCVINSWEFLQNNFPWKPLLFPLSTGYLILGRSFDDFRRCRSLSLALSLALTLSLSRTLTCSLARFLCPWFSPRAPPLSLSLARLLSLCQLSADFRQIARRRFQTECTSRSQPLSFEFLFMFTVLTYIWTLLPLHTTTPPPPPPISIILNCICQIGHDPRLPANHA